MIPIPSTVFGFLCSAIWFSYGVFVNDIAIMIPNGLGIIFNVVNILTLIFLPAPKQDYTKVTEKNEEESNTVGYDEVRD